jgi:hypothetical protein
VDFRPAVGQRLEQFELQETRLFALEDGQVLVRVKLINIHANTRTRMARGMIEIGETELSNYACAEVVQSRDTAFKEGDVIACQRGSQDYQMINSKDGPAGGYGAPSELVKALNGTGSPWTYVFRPAMVKIWPPEVLMEMFGTSGMTAPTPNIPRRLSARIPRPAEHPSDDEVLMRVHLDVVNFWVAGHQRVSRDAVQHIRAAEVEAAVRAYIQKADGPFQFFVQVGAYAIPSQGAPIYGTFDQTRLLFGPVPGPKWFT